MTTRLLAVGALVLAIGVVSWTLLHQRSPYEITVLFTDGGQLVRGDQVRLGAATIGSVRSIRLEDNGTVAVRLRLRGPADPLPLGTVARIRLDSLSGVANRYVSLSLPIAGRRTLPNGGLLPLTSSESPVDLDALVDVFDRRTRTGLQGIFRGSGQQYDHRSAEAKASLEALAPALQGVGLFSEQFTHDRVGFLKLLRDGAVATQALAGRRAQLTDAIDKAQVTTEAIGDEGAALADALRRLPPVLAHGSRTFAALRSTLDVIDPLVAAAKTSVERVPGFFDRLDTVLTTGAGPLTRLADSTHAPGADNDLIDLLDDVPAYERLTRTAFPRAIRTADAARSQLDDLLAYTPDLISSFSHLGQVSANYDANGHYARIQPDLLAFTHDPATNSLSLTPPGRALDTLPTHNGARCPGATIAPVPGDSIRTAPGCSLAAGVATR